MARKREDVLNDIKTVFDNDNDLFNDCLEELDDHNSYLYDDRWIGMEEFNDCMCGQSPLDIILSIDLENFNPRDWYFRYDGYGHAVSSNHKDYSDWLSMSTIEDFAEHRNKIHSISSDSELNELYDELEECDE